MRKNPPRRHPCAALDADGKRCRRFTNTRKVQYHGDNEIYNAFDKKPQWVEVWICDRHELSALDYGDRVGGTPVSPVPQRMGTRRQ